MAKVLLVVALASLLAAAAQSRTPKAIPKSSKTSLPNKPPSVKLVASADRVVVACELNKSVTPSCQGTSTKIRLSAQASDPDGDTLLYTYSTTGGRIDGEGPEAALDLAGAAPGFYTVTVEVNDRHGGVATDTARVTVEHCACDPPPSPPCPRVSVSCPTEPVKPGMPITFTANVSEGDPNVTPTFNWTVSAGTISSGQGTNSITVDTTGVTNMVGAAVDVGGYDRACSTAASCASIWDGPPLSRKWDEYGGIEFKDEKARLDQLAAELRNDPTAQGYLLCYGGRRSRVNEAQRRCDRAKNFLVISRGIDVRRVVTVDGGYREGPTTELWLVPAGSTPPQASPTVDPSEVTPPPGLRTTRRRPRR